jgi:hypothetical protein
MRNISLAVATLLVAGSSSLFAEDKNDWKFSGNLRTGYTSETVDAPKVDSVTNTGAATGGWLTLQTPEVNKFSVTASLFTSQILLGQKSDWWLHSGGAGETNGKSYTYFGEAYISGELFSEDSIIGKTDITIGRKVIETPFANSDDMGMSPDSFELAMLQANPVENLTVIAARATKIGGYDAPLAGAKSKDEFVELTQGDGVSIVAGIYSDEENGIAAQAWNYYLDDLDGEGLNMSLTYADLVYTMNLSEDTSVSVGAEYGLYQELNFAERDGSLVGGKIEASISDLSLGVAMDSASGDIAPQGGFSFAPYYTIANIYLTIAAPGVTDITAFSGKADYQVTEELSLSALYMTMSSDNLDDDWSELDLSASYSVSDDLAIDLYMATWNEGETDFTRYTVFANYSF